MGPLLRSVLNRAFEEECTTALLCWLRSASLRELIGVYFLEDDRVDEELQAYIQDELQRRGQSVGA